MEVNLQLICVRVCLALQGSISDYLVVFVISDGGFKVTSLIAFLYVDNLVFGKHSVPHGVKGDPAGDPVGQDLPSNVLKQLLARLPDTARRVAITRRLSHILLAVEFKQGLGQYVPSTQSIQDVAI